MGDRFNTTAGWVLFAGIIALGLSSISMRIFHTERPEEMSYPIEGVVTAGADDGPSLAMMMSKADVSKGEKVFAKCIACHTINQGGADGIGPNLYGIMGLPIGKHAAGFAYSSALAEKGGDWNFENMDAWLKSPRGFASGTKMSFAGLSKIDDRAAVIVYMNSMGSNIPLPEVVEEAAADAETTGDEAEAEADLEGEAAAEEDAAAEENEGGK
ncbi:cytochrome c family protein [Altererythrobacter sp. ZODW24]|uniref:c-type cytochrome n=1 Tax=Altererythrobacter sp. ZODW24 TaxID=2185142 RepID=UPI000DF7AFDE|nr:cytochrome c family protein [Altererythrobacter sp. ZODW24]